MKILITGSSGFIGRHLGAELGAEGHEVIRCDLKVLENTITMDILNQDMIQRILTRYKPDIENCKRTTCFG